MEEPLDELGGGGGDGVGDGVMVVSDPAVCLLQS